MLYIANSFTLGMLPQWRQEGAVSGLNIVPIQDPAAFLSAAEAQHGAAVSVVGHADTAALFSALLGREVAANRQSLTLNGDDEMLVGQYSGPRLPEGSTTLPGVARINWIAVSTQ